MGGLFVINNKSNDKSNKKIGRGWQASLPRQIAVLSNLEGALYESET